MKDIEVEIQVKISNPTRLLKYLAQHGTHKGDEYQKDEYYSPAHRDFAGVRPVAEWLRLRESDTCSMTYKHWKYDENGKSHYCDEYETKIEDVDQARKIFAAIDMKPVITIEKQRSIWRHKDYEIAIDKVTGLGDFVEIEYKSANAADPDDLTAGMIAWLKSIDCGTIERNYLGYAFMMLYPDEITHEVV